MVKRKLQNLETKSKSTDPKRQKNFFLVASRSSRDHSAFRRNLEVLLKLSMIIEERDLALDLGRLTFPHWFAM